MNGDRVIPMDAMVAAGANSISTEFDLFPGKELTPDDHRAVAHAVLSAALGVLEAEGWSVVKLKQVAVRVPATVVPSDLFYDWGYIPIGDAEFARRPTEAVFVILDEEKEGL